MVLQGTVNAWGAFMDVNCGWPGSVGDERIFENSSLCRRIEAAPSLLPEGTFLLGDKAYTLTCQMMTPHRRWNDNSTRWNNRRNNMRNNNSENGGDGPRIPRFVTRFNKVHSQTRVVVETAFGALKGRWRRLLHEITLDMEFVPDIVMACCILHNICVMMWDPISTEDLKTYVARERAQTMSEVHDMLQTEYGDVDELLATRRRVAMTIQAAHGHIVNFGGNASEKRVAIGKYLVRYTRWNN